MSQCPRYIITNKMPHAQHSAHLIPIRKTFVIFNYVKYGVIKMFEPKNPWD